MHLVSTIFKKKAHEMPIKSMGVIADGPRISTGSSDCSVKVSLVYNTMWTSLSLTLAKLLIQCIED